MKFYSTPSPVPSPCIRSCCLDDEDMCMGCGRELAEITGWQAMTNDEKSRVILKAKERLNRKHS